MLKDKIELFLNDYLDDKIRYKSLEGPKKLKDLSSAQLLMDKIPSELQKASSLSSNYKFKGSVGQGNVAEIPHLCIYDLDITNSAMRGYYIVYLFSSDLSRMYLSLNQGWTQYVKEYRSKRGTEEIKKNAKLAQNLLRSLNYFSLDPIDLSTKDDLGIGYENGNICSQLYRKSNIPTDADLINDLRNMVGVYQELKGLVGNSIIDINYRESELEFQVKIQSDPPKRLPKGPILRKETKSFGQRSFWPRDSRVAASALENSNYSCETDPNHQTFKSLKSGHQFMEAHHLIPMGLQDEFENSLDVPENIISLCPNCHRAFHNAEIGVRAVMIKKFYAERNEKLSIERGISIGLNRLIEFYHSMIEE
jgi:5-methylcytosine-specific restriction protein A